jgi:hypothetical protein
MSIEHPMRQFPDTSHPDLEDLAAL